MAGADGPEFDDATSGGDTSGLASVVQIDRSEEIAAVCGRIDTAPTFAVVVHAPKGNRRLATELGIRRLQRHAEESGKVIAIATGSGALANRARQAGIPVARKPEHVRWDAGGRTTIRMLGHTLVTPALGRYAQGSLVLILTLLFLGLAATLAPAGKVVAFPPAEEVVRVVTITASLDRDSIDLESLAVPARQVSAEQAITLAVRTTGVVPVATKAATAVVSMTNASGKEVLVPAGAELLADPGGISFELGADTVVPAGATVTQGATARVPGVQGNVPAGAIRRWKDTRYQALTVTNAEVAAGGAAEPMPAVDARDIASIHALAEDLGRSEAIRRIVLSARPRDAVFLGTAEASVEPGEPSALAGAPADMITLDVKVTVTALAVLQGTLEDLARRLLTAERPELEFIPGSATAVETGARRVDPESGSIRTDVEVRGLFAKGVSRSMVRSAVQGKSEADAKSTLARRYGIDDAEVDVSPGWAPWLPRFGFRIDVEFRSRPPAEKSNAEGAPGDASNQAAPGQSGTPSPGP